MEGGIGGIMVQRIVTSAKRRSDWVSRGKMKEVSFPLDDEPKQARRVVHGTINGEKIGPWW